jgi:hypothetical protein
MRLIPPVWRTAWYEEGLSERFVQEMTRLEKSTVKELGTSAEWVEQLIIELGQLTQNMIHLEGELPRPHQLKLALERALKLAALSAHLMAALDHALDHGPSVLRYSEGAETRSRSQGPAETRDGGTAGAYASEQTPAAWTGTEHSGLAIPTHGGNGHMPAQSAPVTQTQAAGSAAPPSPAGPGLRASPQVQVGLKRQASPEIRTPTQSPREGGKPAPFVNNLIELSQPMIDGGASPAREMILALSRRGLSRSEIEVITEQPRHIIEAVLQHG